MHLQEHEKQPVAAEPAGAAQSAAPAGSRMSQQEQQQQQPQRMPRMYSTSSTAAAAGAPRALGRSTDSSSSLRQRFYWDVDKDEVTFASSNTDSSTSTAKLHASAEFSQMAQREAEDPLPSHILGEVVERKPITSGSTIPPPYTGGSSKFAASRHPAFPKAVHRSMQQPQRQPVSADPAPHGAEAACADAAAAARAAGSTPAEAGGEAPEAKIVHLPAGAAFMFDSREAAKLQWTDPVLEEGPDAAALLQQYENQKKEQQFADAAHVPLLQQQQQQLAALRFDFNGRLRTDVWGLHAATAAVVALWQQLLLPQEQHNPQNAVTAAAAAAADEAGVCAWLTPSDAAAVTTAAEAAAAAATDPLDRHKGLHHHGRQPEAAGYTLEESVMLAHSAAPAQRALAVRTLGQLVLAARALCLFPNPALSPTSPPGEKGEAFAALRKLLSPLLPQRQPQNQQQFVLRGGFGFGLGRFLRFLFLDEHLLFRLCGALMAESATVAAAAAASVANLLLPIHPTRRIGPLKEQRLLQLLLQEEQAAPDSGAAAAVYLPAVDTSLCCAVAKPFLSYLRRHRKVALAKPSAGDSGESVAAGGVCSCFWGMSDSVAADEEPALFPLGGVDLLGCMYASKPLWPAAGGAAAADARICLGPGSAWAALATRWKDLSPQQQRNYLDEPLGESFGRHPHAAAVDFALLLPRVAMLLRRCWGVADEEQDLVRLLCGICVGGPQQVQQILQQPELLQQLLLLADGLLLGGETRRRRRAAAMKHLLPVAEPILSNTGTTSNMGVSEEETDEYNLDEQRLVLQLLLLLRICAIRVERMQHLECLFGCLELEGIDDSSSTSGTTSSVLGLVLQCLMTVVQQPQLQLFEPKQKKQQKQGRQEDLEHFELLPVPSVLRIAAAAAAARLLRVLHQRGSCAVPLQPLLPAFAAHVKAFCRRLQELNGHLLLQQLSSPSNAAAGLSTSADETCWSLCMEHSQTGSTDGGGSDRIREKARQLLRFEGELVLQLLLWVGDALSASFLQASLLLSAASDLLASLQPLQTHEPESCSRLATAAVWVLLRCTDAARWRHKDGTIDEEALEAAASAPCDDPGAALAAAAAAAIQGDTEKLLLLERWRIAMASPLHLLLGPPGGDVIADCGNTTCSFSKMGYWGAALNRVLLLFQGCKGTVGEPPNTLLSTPAVDETAEMAQADWAATRAMRSVAGAVSSYLSETGWTLATRCCSPQTRMQFPCNCVACKGRSSSSKKPNTTSGMHCSKGAACSTWIIPTTSESFAVVSADAFQAARVAAAASLLTASADAPSHEAEIGASCQLLDPRGVEMLLVDVQLLRGICEAFSACAALLVDVGQEVDAKPSSTKGASVDGWGVWVRESSVLLKRPLVQRFAAEAMVLAKSLTLLLETLHEKLRMPQQPQQQQGQQQGERDLTPFLHSAVISTAPTLPQDDIAACALAALDAVSICFRYLDSAEIEPRQQQAHRELSLRCVVAALANAATTKTVLKAFGHLGVYLQQHECESSSSGDTAEKAKSCVWGAAAETIVGCSNTAEWDMDSVQQLHAALTAAAQQQQQQQQTQVPLLVADIEHYLEQGKQHSRMTETLDSALFVSAIDMMAGAPLWGALLRNAADPVAAARGRISTKVTQHLRRLLLVQSAALGHAVSRVATPGYCMGGLLRCMQLQQETRQSQQQGQQPEPVDMPGDWLQEWKLFDVFLLQPMGTAWVAPLAAETGQPLDANDSAAYAKASDWRKAMQAAADACAEDVEKAAAAAAAANALSMRQSADRLRLAASRVAVGGEVYICCCESASSFAARGALELLQQMQASAAPEPQQLLLLLLLGSSLMPRAAREQVWGDEGALAVLDRNSVLLDTKAAASAAATVEDSTFEAVLRFAATMQWGFRTPQNEWQLCCSAASNCMLMLLLCGFHNATKDEALQRQQRAHLRRQLGTSGGLASAAAAAAMATAGT
ncbi:uncharacterized protein LOC34622116 [Cyclospora cayetanensis]|uniref:Uncharacterized protein LOC34622116 n=1 Tax=Cyclospora cayetanensis TaxID=88456 RepID=A0A6P6S0L3_9EIME|nr:uncharacterized protein LOC34622116 [Cyclospora cayetanensis]